MKTLLQRSSTTRDLILPDYHDFDDDVQSNERTTKGSISEDNNDEDLAVVYDDDTTTTTTTTLSTTTRRWNQRFPMRNPDLIPSRRPVYVNNRP